MERCLANKTTVQRTRHGLLSSSTTMALGSAARPTGSSSVTAGNLAARKERYGSAKLSCAGDSRSTTHNTLQAVLTLGLAQSTAVQISTRLAQPRPVVEVSCTQDAVAKVQTKINDIFRGKHLGWGGRKACERREHAGMPVAVVPVPAAQAGIQDALYWLLICPAEEGATARCASAYPERALVIVDPVLPELLRLQLGALDHLPASTS